MNIKTTVLRTAIMTALGSVLVPATSSAVSQLVPDGKYQLRILNNVGGAAYATPGSDGAWESTFTFGGKKPNATSQPMFDAGPTIVHTVTTGVSDTYAGVLNITVTGGTFTVSDFQVDPIFGTAGGTFIQYASTNNTTDTTSTMGGTITQTTGASQPIGTMILDPTGRLGAVSAPPSPALVNERWNVDTNKNGTNGAYQTFSTGSAQTNNSTGGTCPTGCTVINGAGLKDIGDVNGDGVHDFSAVLVSGGQVGNDWGGFLGASYLETWRIQLVSDNAPVAGTDTVSTPVNTALDISVLTNDTGTPPLSVTGIPTNAAHGNAVVKSGNTVVTYTPTTGYTGPDTFTYTVKGGNGKSATGTVNVTVLASGTPIAQSDSGSTLQNNPVAIDVLANDTANGGSKLDKSSVKVSTNPTHGSITNINTTTGAITYAPTTGYVGQDSFTYTVSNTDPTPSNPATVTVNVTATALTSSGSYAPGSYASDPKVSSSNGFLTDANLTTLGGIPKDDTPGTGVAVRCASGCYDFQVTGVTNGTVVNIVLPPLSAVIATDSRYRKFIAPTAGGTKVWVNFDTSNSVDKISSAPKDSGGGCPLPASLTWIPWTGATPPLPVPTGHQCVRLTITDGGPNDDDHSANGTIVDLGGVSSGTAAAAETIPTPGGLNDFSSSSGGGCTITDTSRTARDSADWWLVGGFIAWLGMVIRRKRTQ